MNEPRTEAGRVFEGELQEWLDPSVWNRIRRSILAIEAEAAIPREAPLSREAPKVLRVLDSLEGHVRELQALIDTHNCEGPALSREALADTLAQHWVTAMECDHDAKTDTVRCSCSVWTGTPQPSVGAAARQWASHVLAALPTPAAAPEAAHYMVGDHGVATGGNVPAPAAAPLDWRLVRQAVDNTMLGHGDLTVAHPDSLRAEYERLTDE